VSEVLCFVSVTENLVSSIGIRILFMSVGEQNRSEKTEIQESFQL
jgi:hypothetical protein